MSGLDLFAVGLAAVAGGSVLETFVSLSVGDS